MTGALSFGIAGALTGVPFHIHGPTFAETIYGRKVSLFSYLRFGKVPK